MSAIAIHLGGRKDRKNKKIYTGNYGKLLTRDLIKILDLEAKKMKAEAFTTDEEVRFGRREYLLTIARQLLKTEFNRVPEKKRLTQLGSFPGQKK